MAKLYVESELYHYGVPGMRWGHRKVYDPSSASIGKNRRERKKARFDERKALKRAAGSITNQRKDEYVKKAIEADKRAKELDAEIAAAKKAKQAERNEVLVRADKASSQGKHLDSLTMKAYANKGKTYATNILAGALAGVTVTGVKNLKSFKKNDPVNIVKTLLKGATAGAAIGAATANVTIHQGNKNIKKSKRQDNKK